MPGPLLPRVRDLIEASDVTEQPFLGGRGFYRGGSLVFAVVDDDIVVNHGAMAADGEVFRFAGRVVAGWHRVPSNGLEEEVLASLVAGLMAAE